MTKIEEATRTQSENLNWKAVRVGRITASNFGEVASRVTTLQDPASNRSKDTVPLISKLMNYTSPPENLPQFVHGHKCEKEARKFYTAYQTDKGHVNLKVEECGMFLDRKRIYLGASPDYLISCDCCGDGVMEVKSPLTTPTFLGDGKLKENHNYFAQVQGQMLLTGRTFCDFCVYTKTTFTVERISMNTQYCEKLVEKLDFFFINYLLPELITHKHRPEAEKRQIKKRFSRKSILNSK